MLPMGRGDERAVVRRQESEFILDQLASRRAAIADSFFYMENVERNHPIGINENMHEAMATYERVRRTADVILPLYDPKNMDRFPGGVVK